MRTETDLSELNEARESANAAAAHIIWYGFSARQLEIVDAHLESETTENLLTVQRPVVGSLTQEQQGRAHLLIAFSGRVARKRRNRTLIQDMASPTPPRTANHVGITHAEGDYWGYPDLYTPRRPLKVPKTK